MLMENHLITWSKDAVAQRRESEQRSWRRMDLSAKISKVEYPAGKNKREQSVSEDSGIPVSVFKKKKKKKLV